MIAFGYIKAGYPGQQTEFAIRGCLRQTGAALTPYFTKFIVNADQLGWFQRRTAQLMQHLKATISRTVAALGDIHSFFAGTGQATILMRRAAVRH